MKLFLFVLLAVPVTDSMVAVPNTQTIRYFETMAECHTERNRIEPSIDKNYVKLKCEAIEIK
jgi:hypothetical protein